MTRPPHALQLAEEDQKERLAEVIKRSVAAVRRTSFGKNFHTRLVDRYPAFFQSDLGIHTVSWTVSPSVTPSTRQRSHLSPPSCKPRCDCSNVPACASAVLCPHTPRCRS